MNLRDFLQVILQFVASSDFFLSLGLFNNHKLWIWMCTMEMKMKKKKEKTVSNISEYADFHPLTLVTNHRLLHAQRFTFLRLAFHINTLKKTKLLKLMKKLVVVNSTTLHKCPKSVKCKRNDRVCGRNRKDTRRISATADERNSVSHIYTLLGHFFPVVTINVLKLRFRPVIHTQPPVSSRFDIHPWPIQSDRHHHRHWHFTRISLSSA